MGGSDPKTFEVAESSPLRVLWIVLPLLAAFVACVYAQLYKAPASAPWIEVALSPPWFRMGGSAAWSLLVIAVLGIGLGAAFRLGSTMRSWPVAISIPSSGVVVMV